MRYPSLFALLFGFLSSYATAQWQKISDTDYIWGPFKIYNISLFSETGDYQPNQRPLMLSLKYNKPVDGRDFAISLAKSWANLGIQVADQNKAIDTLRKTLPDIKPDDTLSYIALEDKGYFVLNNEVIAEEFPQALNDAIVAVWLDPKVEIGKKLTHKQAETSVVEAQGESAEFDVTPERALVTVSDGKAVEAVKKEEKVADSAQQVETKEPATPSEKAPEQQAPEEAKPQKKAVMEEQNELEKRLKPIADPLPADQLPVS